MNPETKIQIILSALRAFALSAVFAVALIALAPAAFAETKTERLLGEPLNELAVDENGWTHLHWAVVANDEESVRRLLEMGAPVDFTDNGDGSYFSDEANLRFLVALGRKSGNLHKWGMTPLWLLVFFVPHSVPLVSILIDSGANVNAKISVGDTLLHAAVIDKETETAALLLENGADVNAKGMMGETPLHRVAAHVPTLEMAALLIESGADVGAKDNDGRTPLHRAVAENATEMAALLLENGADVNAKNKYGRTPLHSAAFENQTEAAALLIKSGAYVGAEDNQGSTPWHFAKSHEMQQVLLRKHGGRKR